MEYCIKFSMNPLSIYLAIKITVYTPLQNNGYGISTASSHTDWYLFLESALDQAENPGSEQPFKSNNDLLFIWASQDKDYFSCDLTFYTL